jgi:hypothetical protein
MDSLNGNSLSPDRVVTITLSCKGLVALCLFIQNSAPKTTHAMTTAASTIAITINRILRDGRCDGGGMGDTSTFMNSATFEPLLPSTWYAVCPLIRVEI